MKKNAKSTKETQSRNSKKPEAEDIIALIIRDHEPLKRLIETLKDGEVDRSEKEISFEEFVPLLVAHAKAEEKSLYVQMKGMKNLRMEGFEGDTEHAIAEQLIHEINSTPDDDEWNGKVKVLAELIEHHIEEEENEMLKEVEKQMDYSIRQAVGEVYRKIKIDLDLLYRPRPIQQYRNIEHRLN